MMQASLEGEFVSIFLKIKSKLWAEIQSQIESEGKSINEFVSEVLGKSVGRKKKVPVVRKTHPRLEEFCRQYEEKFKRKYIVGNYAEEGGAASKTLNKVSDEEWSGAIGAYFKDETKRAVEAGYPFMWFLRDLNRWVVAFKVAGRWIAKSQRYEAVEETRKLLDDVFKPMSKKEEEASRLAREEAKRQLKW